MPPQAGDRIRLDEDAEPCQKGDEGYVDDVLSNGKLVVVCDMDSECNPKGPDVCTVKDWVSPRC